MSANEASQASSTDTNIDLQLDHDSFAVGILISGVKNHVVQKLFQS